MQVERRAPEIDRVVSVMIAANHQLVRGGLRAVFQGQPGFRVAGEVASVGAAVAEARRSAADVVVADLPGSPGELPSSFGLVNRTGTAVPVLLLARREAQDQVLQALACGADGFILQDAPLEELVFATAALAAGGAFVTPSLMWRLIERLPTRPDLADRAHRSPSTLTERELDVMRLVAGGLSNREIASALEVAETTVRSHVSHLLDKLDLENRVQIVIVAYESGVVQGGPRLPAVRFRPRGGS